MINGFRLVATPTDNQKLFLGRVILSSIIYDLSMLKKDSTAQNLRPIEVESPQPEERGRGLVTDSGKGVEGNYSGWRSKKY